MLVRKTINGISIIFSLLHLFFTVTAQFHRKLEGSSHYSIPQQKCTLFGLRSKEGKETSKGSINILCSNAINRTFFVLFIITWMSILNFCSCAASGYTQFFSLVKCICILQHVYIFTLFNYLWNQIILKEDVAYVGKQGQLLDVKAGFFRNYLLPMGKAQLVTPQLLK